MARSPRMGLQNLLPSEACSQLGSYFFFSRCRQAGRNADSCGRMARRKRRSLAMNTKWRINWRREERRGKGETLAEDRQSSRRRAANLFAVNRVMTRRQSPSCPSHCHAILLPVLFLPACSEGNCPGSRDHHSKSAAWSFLDSTSCFLGPLGRLYTACRWEARSFLVRP